MIRPFGLGDVLLIRRLQRQGMSFDLQRSLTGGETPAWAALTAPFRWWGGGVMTYVLQQASGGDERHAGFIQMRLRPGRPEADVTFIAPAVEGREGDEEMAILWRRLLAHCVRQAGERGVQRIFISAPDEAQETLSLLRQAGFSLYTREEVYHAAEPFRPTASPGEGRVRPLAAADEWALRKLYTAITPRLVQQAEGMGGGQADGPLPPWWASGYTERFTLRREDGIAGLVAVWTGRRGHCLRLWGDFREAEEVLALLERGLAALSLLPPRPVYCLVREYQGGVRSPLAECGFRLMATWSCLVKHTVVRLREPARRALPVLEPRPEPSVPGALSTGR